MLPTHNSLAISTFFPVWYLGTFPDRKIIVTSYSHDLCLQYTQMARDTFRDWAPSLFGLQLSSTKAQAGNWGVEGHLGEVYAGGLLGGLTGRGANILVGDDVQNGPEETESKVQRDRSWRAFGAAATTRLAPGGSVVLVMTRWHQDDIAARALEQGDWHVISFPAIAEDNDVLGRKPGDPLWPPQTLPDGRIVGFGVEELAQRRKTLPSDYYWWAEYQQRPVPPGGSLFRQEWFRYFYQDANYYYLKHPQGDITVPRPRCWRFAIADTASTAKTHSDYTAIGVFDVTPDKHLLLLHMFRAKLEVPDVENAIRQVIAKWRPKFVGIEAKSTGLAVVQSLKRAGLPVREVVPRKGDAKFEPDKLVRSIEAQGAYQAGRIWHFEGTSWLADFEEELLSFSPDMAHAHDDQVDVVSYACKELAHILPTQRARPFALGGVKF